jgi:hypothetical protein
MNGGMVDDKPYHAPQEHSPLPAKRNAAQDRRPRSPRQLYIALTLILVGIICWYVGIDLIFSGGSGLGELLAFSGPFISGIGVVWLLIVFILRLLDQTPPHA